ncbi:MAG: hypothetical protein HN348_28285 [Proteobacteria bacterium]|nr:hypothetical protein [Pseudomonadota bacterium]
MSVKALLRLSSQSAESLHQARLVGDNASAEHEERKLEIAAKKAEEKAFEAQQCLGHSYSLSGEVVNYEIAPKRTFAKRNQPPRKKSPPPPAGPMSSSSISIDFADEDDAPAVTGKDLEKAPEVTAAALSVVIPANGEAVLYQQLLLSASARPTVMVKAKLKKR